MFAFVLLLSCLHGNLSAQIHIAHIQPDVAAPGMTLALEVMAPASDSNAFGADGLDVKGTAFELMNPTDTNRVVIGPAVTSWKGRLLQIPFIILPNASTGALIFRIRVGSKTSLLDTFNVVQPSPALVLSNGAVLGDGASGGVLTSANTIVVDSIILHSGLTSGGKFEFSKIDTSYHGPGNHRYLPVTILSKGPIRMDTVLFSANADTLLNGGPGGGGGGHGFAGSGGEGFSGGGNNDSASVLDTTNRGTGGDPTDSTGGATITGVLGGSDDQGDNGGGGGTGCPFGTSGSDGTSHNSSLPGGYGGGSAGGEAAFDTTTFGGGGGGFGTDGMQGVTEDSNSNNGGRANGGRFLAPLQGGSGGGGGNSTDESPGTGSGGGGGGAISIVSYDAITLNDVWLSANGANGKNSTVRNVGSGGGGGSGGAFLIAPLRGMTVTQTTITENGGHAGSGGRAGDNGGAGGLGRLRFDGKIPTWDPNPINVTAVFGPSLTPIDGVVTTPQIIVSGFDEDTANLTDSLRIYYRDRHSSWQSITVKRLQSNGHFVWSSPSLYTRDSLLFVVAYGQVRAPQRSPAMFEPNWLLSHISMGLVNRIPSPYLVSKIDTVDFGCVRVNTCDSGSVMLADQGEAPLAIDSIELSDGLDFSLLTKPPISIASYDSSLVGLQFCPQKLGSFQSVMTIYSNDSIRMLVLKGCGLSKDDRDSIYPRNLDFSKVKVGTCDTLYFKIFAVGLDTSFVSLRKLLSPFGLLSNLDSAHIPPNDSIVDSIVFCPTDSGSFTDALVFQQDTLLMAGVGTRSILSVGDTLNVGALCIGNCETIAQILTNEGNDAVTITSITGFDPSTTARDLTLPLKILPHDSITMHWTVCPHVAGYFSSFIHIDSPDSSMTFRLVGKAKTLALNPSSLDFGVVCATGDTSRDSIVWKNLSTDSLSLFEDSLLASSRFGFKKTTVGKIIAPGDSISIQIFFHPATTGTFTDTLLLGISNGACDSVLKLPITGEGTHQAAAFIDSLLLFDSVLVGTCKFDTTTLINPCDTALFVGELDSLGAFSLVSDESFSLTKGGSETVIVEFCPADTGIFTGSKTFVDIAGDTFRVQLRGRGMMKTIDSTPSAVFAISNAIGQVGQSLVTTLTLQSLSGITTLDSFSGILRYDPSVVIPQSITPVVGHPSYVITGKETAQPGTFSFNVTGGNIIAGPIATISWLGLLGSADSTLDTLGDLLVSPSGLVTGNTGVIHLISCGNLAGNVTIAGPYAMSLPTPNPASNHIRLILQIGADGLTTLRILNAIGAEETRILDGASLSAGIHELDIDLLNLPSGVHFVQCNSQGWQSTRSFLLSK
jgi:hypothetical protein